MNVPVIYNIYQRLVVKNSFRKYYAKDILNAQENAAFLDIGCGTGNMVPFLPKNIDYTGLDLSPAYINHAKKRFPQHKFFAANVNDITLEKNKYDIAISNGVIMSLSDSDAGCLFQLAADSLKPGGILAVYDGHYNDTLTLGQKFFVQREREQNIRTHEQYRLLASKYFKNVTVILKDDAFNIPYPMIIMRCVK